MNEDEDNKPVVLGPSSRKQKLFMQCEADIVLYGGGAGAGD